MFQNKRSNNKTLKKSWSSFYGMCDVFETLIWLNPIPVLTKMICQMFQIKRSKNKTRKKVDQKLVKFRYIDDIYNIY